MDVMIPRRRRKHSEAFKQSVIGACCEPGQSVAGVALTHGLNANLVRRWLRERDIEPASRRHAQTVAVSEGAMAGFVPVALAPTPAQVIRIEVARGAARVKLEWPTDAAGACGAWLREWLA